MSRPRLTLLHMMLIRQAEEPSIGLLSPCLHESRIGNRWGHDEQTCRLTDDRMEWLRSCIPKGYGKPPVSGRHDMHYVRRHRNTARALETQSYSCG